MKRQVTHKTVSVATQLSDEQLSMLIQQGDKEKFGLLVDRYQKKLLRYGRKFLLGSENTEDLVQDTFIKAYQNIKSFNAKQKFSPWIYRIAHNTFINALKKKSLNPIYLLNLDAFIPHLQSDDVAANEREQKEIKALLASSMAKLPSHYREILVLYYYEELSYKEIADILRIPAGTVAIRLKRARLKLQHLLPKDSL